MPKPDRTIYYHDCKKLGMKVITDNRDPCRFCEKRKWRVLVRLYKEEEKKPSLLERIVERIKI